MLRYTESQKHITTEVQQKNRYVFVIERENKNSVQALEKKRKNVILQRQQVHNYPRIHYNKKSKQTSNTTVIHNSTTFITVFIAN